MKINFNYGCKIDVLVLNNFDGNRVSILSFKKNAFVDRVFTLM